MPAKKKQVFVTPFSSQKTQDVDVATDPPKQRKQTPVGSFFFPVSASRIEKIQHVTPMTRKKIRQGLSKAIGTFPQGLDPKSPAVTFLTVSQATESGEAGAPVEEILDEIDELLSDNEEIAVDIGDGDLEVESCSTGYTELAPPPMPIHHHRGNKKQFKPRRNTKLLQESVKQEVLKTIYKMHQEIMEFQDRRIKLNTGYRREEGKDREWIQSFTTPDSRDHMGKWHKHKKTPHTRKPRYQPIPRNTNNNKDPQKKHRLGTVSTQITGGGYIGKKAPIKPDMKAKRKGIQSYNIQDLLHKGPLTDCVPTEE